jgi:hypothetical protein
MIAGVLHDHEVIDDVTFSAIVPVHKMAEDLERRITV